ncbi:MAG: homocysteine S-methyltransferase family protein [Verrucomicrobiae bacterium]|nr:homocysteine S-methyltransferase family protein [Verrucomicrobiae bacterium]MDW7979085.1 homocysteine S-methyltransferase family protein [Verrucomicrobiales bacterium]
MHPLIEQLIGQRPIITDGAWGTQLQARGLGIGELPDAMNLLRPDAVAEVARAYVEAGSQIILTNTFGSNRLRLADYSLADKVVELNRRGVEISRNAAAGRAYVFASIGPSGKMLFSGEVSESDLHEAFEEQAAAIAEANPDGIVIESMTDLQEALIAVEAVRKTGLPVVACMVFDSGKDRDRTMMGVTPEQAASALEAAGADVIGANCGRGIAGFALICARLRAGTNRPIWLKPNAGLPEIVDGRPCYRTTPDEFARAVPELVDAGASFVGGCCGTNPEFISAIRQVLGRCAQA